MNAPAANPPKSFTGALVTMPSNSHPFNFIISVINFIFRSTLKTYDFVVRCPNFLLALTTQWLMQTSLS
jgi:hypothetical protein